MEKNLAVITGADGGMGLEICHAVARARYKVIMACLNPDAAEPKRMQLIKETENTDIRILKLDLSSLQSVCRFAQEVTALQCPIDLLMNNAGTLSTYFRRTKDGLEHTVSVNYVGPYLLTRKLIPLMHPGSRIVNMVSCTYVLGKLGKDFFSNGRKGAFRRISVYSNTKLALWLFTFRLAALLQEKGITVNAADPGIVSTGIITMDQWFDPLTDIFFRPFIRTPFQGAATAVRLLLSQEMKGETGNLYANGKKKKVNAKFMDSVWAQKVWEDTETQVKYFL